MSIDLELAKKHKEYIELEEKINPLRTEHNFLVDSIDKLGKEKVNQEKYIKGLKDEFYREKLEREIKRDKEKGELDSFKLALDGQKNTQKALYTKENKELQGVKSKLDNEIKELGKDLEDNTKKNTQLITERDKIIKIKNEYEKVYNENKKEIDEGNKQLKINNDIISKREIEVIKKEKELNREIEKYEKLKKEVESNRLVVESNMMEQITKEQELLKLQADIDRKIISMSDKEKEVKDIYIKSKEIMQQIEEKELKVGKTISEFQDEKYKFLVLMKQKGIKKSDIEDLDKEFNL